MAQAGRTSWTLLVFATAFSITGVLGQWKNFVRNGGCRV